MRDKTFSNVDLPAPFRPITPTTAPRGTSKDTSFSAQINSLGISVLAPPDLLNIDRTRRKGAVTASVTLSRKVLYRSIFPIRYCLLRPSTRMAMSGIKEGGVRSQKSGVRSQESEWLIDNPPKMPSC